MPTLADLRVTFTRDVYLQIKAAAKASEQTPQQWIRLLVKAALIGKSRQETE